MRHEETVIWFGTGPMSALPSALAWPLWSLLALLGIVIIVYSHQRTLVALTSARRVILTILRTLLWLALMLFLAAPTRIERTHTDDSSKRPLAVLVDRSPSMGVPDQRNKTRLEDAAARWGNLEKEALKTFPKIEYFRFSTTLSPERSLDAALAGESGPANTYLYQSLGEVLAKAPQGGWGAVVCLTDGFDTQSTRNETDFVNKAISANSPVYFLPAGNLTTTRRTMDVREIEIPRNVVQKTSFTWRSVIRSFSDRNRVVTVTLSKKGNVIAQEKLTLGKGDRTIIWSTGVQADETGRIPFEMTLEGDDGTKTTARATVLVSDNQSVRIFYYQGAMGWGYRFLAGILREDPKFRMSSAFHLARKTDIEAFGSSPEAVGTNFHDDELEKLDVVILDGVSSSQLNGKEQQALEKFVRNGGSLLVMATDCGDKGGFAGSPLEKVLPVSFYNTPPDPSLSKKTTQWKRMFSSISVRNGQDAGIPTERMRLTDEFPAKPGMASPEFVNYQLFKDKKPGAEVLAVHSRDNNPDTGKPAILMASQQYGSGQSCVLATDSLWHWKLSQPSQSGEAEIFWQDLLNWLVRTRRNAPVFDHPPIGSIQGLPVTIRIRAANPESVPSLSVEGPDQKTQPCELKNAGTDGIWEAVWTPDQMGDWILIAKDEKGLGSEHLLSVEKQSSPGEFNPMPPDEEKMRKLAEMTGGELIRNRIPLTWSRSDTLENEASVTEIRKPLWHRGWLLAACLACYGTELLARRRWRML